MSTDNIQGRCPICVAENWKIIFYYGLERVPIALCQHCGLHFSKRIYSTSELQSFYSETYFRGDYGYTDYLALEQMKRLTFGDRLSRIEKYLSPPATFLDVGCASGLLVQVALEHSWESFGIDISPAIIAAANPVLQQRLSAGTLADAPFAPESLDVITMSDLVEHVHTPLTVIEQAHDLLRIGGLLFIETPNTYSLLRRIMRSKWPLYRPPEHLVYFNPNLLCVVLKQQGFKIKEVRSSWKAVSVKYLLDKLSPTNPFLVRFLRPLLQLVPSGHFWMPVSSFWLVAEKIGVRKNRT